MDLDRTASVAPVLTVDGPSGSGKGTVGVRIARELGWHFLDSGALYRLVGLAATRAGVPFSAGAALARLAGQMDVSFRLTDAGEVRVLLDGAGVSDEIRTEVAGDWASQVAAMPEVRTALLARQRDFRRPPGLVADGRDMGTTVFPQATLKIYLTASPEIRAQRRYKQLMDKGFDVNLPRLLDEIRSRDARDAGREASPLKPAADAVIIDTSEISIDEVVTRIRSLLQQHRTAP